MSSWERLVENRIQEALARGEFANLRGKGRRVDLSEYFSAPEEWRAAYALMKNADVLPREVELLQEIAVLKAQLAERPEAERAACQRELADKMMQLNLLLERRKRG